jgi:hypothetical protein
VSNGSLEKDAQAVVEISQPLWDAVRATKVPTRAVTPDELHRQLANTGLSKEAAAALTRMLLVTAANVRRSGRSADAVLERLATELPEGLSSRFKIRLQDIAALSAQAHSAAKAMDLAFEHSAIIRDLAIYLDLRPIFEDSDAAPEAVGGFINGFTVRVNYLQNGNEHALELFADIDDLTAIKRQVDRAMAKLAVMRDYLKNPHPTPVMLIGEDDHVTR